MVAHARTCAGRPTEMLLLQGVARERTMLLKTDHVVYNVYNLVHLNKNNDTKQNTRGECINVDTHTHTNIYIYIWRPKYNPYGALK